ncbi:MAG: hypothetical protein ACE5EQ_11510 [Phycisphaerae bacterium]
MPKSIIYVAVILGLAGVGYAVPTVTLMLESPQNGQTVPAGSTVDWTIKASASAADNVGLALIVCDLAQNVTNPQSFDIPPGNSASIDATMSNFNRPAGISNPGEGAEPSGYVGLQRGVLGQFDLRQIGGAQNAMGAVGTTIATNPNVISNVGQGGTPQIVLQGSFPAPATGGTYSFQLENPIANVLIANNSPTMPSPVAAAAVVLAPGSFSFTIADTVGDLNCDGAVNAQDIGPFALALIDASGYAAAHPGCDRNRADTNASGTIDGVDIAMFVNLVLAGG